jgi:NAD(P)H-quinone oxidoreductase subunit 5
MTDSIALLPLIGPLALASVAALARLQPGRDPRRVLAAARVAGVLALLAAAATAALVAAWGPLASPLVAGVFSLRLDALSAMMTALVAFLGAVVLEYSRNYLDGDPRHGTFVGRLALTVAAVMLLVLSGNLVQLAVMWLLTSLALHRLLLFYPERVGAVVAGRKKAIVARLGDLALAGSAVLLAKAFGTTDLGLLAARASEAAAAGAVPAGVPLAAALLVATAALKSAQFPTHGWLAEVMETPTPVSALLHAGILNGGTFLIVRLAPVVLLAPGAMHAMVVIGALTACFASLVMITQTSVKGALAYSSAAHMGFMMLVCGLGAFPVAMLHLVAHSCYKAHAFLSAGGAVEVQRTSQVPGVQPAPGGFALMAALGAGLVTVAVVGSLTGGLPVDRPVTLGLAMILTLALTHLLAQGATGGDRSARGLLARVALAAGATALSFFLLEAASAHLLGPAVPVQPLHDAATVGLMAAAIAAFALVILLQLLLPRIGTSPWLATAYVHVRNGFYANAVFDRLVGALRLRPRPTLTAETR